ncbi:MAG: hypothetical protein K9G34_07485, partial [Melioribacteraceae bacterium]|nr:hypothetical protein [Melioribacteraceae bacterium]
MKRSLLALVGLLLISSFINAQVVKDFEVDVSGFSDGDWGVFITGVEQVADPSSESSGVLAVHLDATQTGGDPKDPAVSYGGFEFENVPTAMVYYLWLPADIPDLVDIKPFAQDDTWDWHDVKYTAGDMPKETWFPVYVNLEAWTRSGSVYGNKINGYGIEFAGWNLAGDDTTWSGTVYIDNLTILGVEPEIYNDFEDQTAGVGSLVGGGWGGAISGINWAADPSSNSTGVVEIPFDGNAGGNDPIYFDNVTEASMYPAIVYDLWVPADAPDSLLLKIFSQDDPNWTWQNDAIYLVDLPKESWVPIIYSFEQKTALGGNFSVKASRIGIEFDRRLMTSADTTWSGTFYLDNIRFIGTETGDKWNVIDFEAAAAGVDGFTSAGWAPATTSMQRIADPSSQSEGVLEVALDFTSSDAIASPKSYVSRNGIILYSEMLQKAANKLTLDVWLPDGFPENYQLGVVVGGGADISNTGWLEIIQPFMGTDSTDGFKTNQWNTMEINIDTLAANSQVDPTQTANIGIQLFIEGEASFVGSIYYDNLTVHGIPEPEGTLS